MNTFTLEQDSYPLIYGGNVPNVAEGYNSSTSRLVFKFRELLKHDVW